MSTPNENGPGENGPGETDPDTGSDPSLDDGESADWADEGGAVPEGPSTATDDA